jgi:hypothetical protein
LLERENSELKAAKLMSMLPSSSAVQLNRQVSNNSNGSNEAQLLRVQLSEKTNEYLRVKEENERLREQV